MSRDDDKIDPFTRAEREELAEANELVAAELTEYFDANWSRLTPREQADELGRRRLQRRSNR